MKKRKIFFLVSIVIAALIVISGFMTLNNDFMRSVINQRKHDISAASDTDDKVLRVGVRNDIPNFSLYNTKTGKYYGLEIDISEELSKRLGYKNVSFVNVEPSMRIQALNNGDADIIIGMYSVNPEREEQVDFGPVYYEDTEELIAEKSSLFEDLRDMKGITVAIHSGTTLDESLREKLVGDSIYRSDNAVDSNIDFKYFISYKTMFDLLETGYVDAVASDGGIAYQYMDPDRAVISVIGSTRYAAAVKKGSELSGPAAEKMQEMLDDGTVKRIVEKWSY